MNYTNQEKMGKGIYWAFTRPDITETLLGFSCIPSEDVIVKDEEDNEVEVGGMTIFSIGLIILRIDLVF